MNGKDITKVAAGVGIGFLLCSLTKSASASTCFFVDYGYRYVATYDGPTQLLSAALGPDVWSVIFAFEVFNEDTGVWDTPIDPVNYQLVHGSLCAIVVSDMAELCGFTYIDRELIG